MAVHNAVGINCQRNSGYRPSRVNIMAQSLSASDPSLSPILYFIITPKQQTVDKIIQYNTTQHNHHKSRKELIYTVINQIKI